MIICDTCSLIFHDQSSYVEYLKNHENKFKRILNKFEQLNKTGKLSTDDIQTGSGKILFEQLNKRENYQLKIYTLGLKLFYLDLFLLHDLMGYLVLFLFPILEKY
jgi:hypothetical protein